MLTEQKIKNLPPKKKIYKANDGEGLFLKVTPSGGKHWRFQYRLAGKDKSISLGEYPTVGLFAAREARRKAQELLHSGSDPSLKRKSEKRQLIKSYENSFEAVARLWFEGNKSRWCEKHSIKTWRRLEIHVFPALGEIPIREIKPMEILVTLQKVEKSSTDNAHRLLHSCSGIFGYALVMGLIEYNPIKDVGRLLLPNIEGSFPVIEIRELPEFLLAFDNVEARVQDKLFFQLLFLTGLRTSELRYSKWADIHPATRELRVRAEVMKMKRGRHHIVPLAHQAIECLRQLHAITGHQEWLFPNIGNRKNPVVNENVINLIIEGMGYKGRMVGHSFRKLFSTVLNEIGCHEGAIERQLAHSDKNKIRAAYNHAEYLDARRAIMQQWADYLDNARQMASIQPEEDSENIRLFLQSSSRQLDHLVLSV